MSSLYRRSQTPEAYIAPPMPEDADPDALEVLYAEWDERDAAYRVAMEAHDEWRIEQEAAVAKARKEVAAAEEAHKKEERAKKIVGAKAKKEATEKKQLADKAKKLEVKQLAMEEKERQEKARVKREKALAELRVTQAVEQEKQEEQEEKEKEVGKDKGKGKAMEAAEVSDFVSGALDDEDLEGSGAEEPVEAPQGSKGKAKEILMDHHQKEQVRAAAATGIKKHKAKSTPYVVDSDNTTGPLGQNDLGEPAMKRLKTDPVPGKGDVQFLGKGSFSACEVYQQATDDDDDDDDLVDDNDDDKHKLCRGLVGQSMCVVVLWDALGRNERPGRMGGRARGCGQAGPPNIWAPTANDNSDERALLGIYAGTVNRQNAPNTSHTPPPPCPPLASPSLPNIAVPHSTQDTYGLNVCESPTL
ncbi:hypothetical protein EDD18DRAFT_1343725 [Armillaria luteobubalina]|uniref:Uncharacterized protein n=1 Tax=Armillaria luteobubalina TaxID=153913 RepID=A0AA39QN97_9AGAR|nr:hypothetical protein EDD18DRAFT_1343725 [Armillaria luteobubalina]